MNNNIKKVKTLEKISTKGLTTSEVKALFYLKMKMYGFSKSVIFNFNYTFESYAKFGNIQIYEKDDCLCVLKIEK